MIKQSISKVLLPKLNEILGKIKKSILGWSKVPLLAKTLWSTSIPYFSWKRVSGIL